ncbi:MAG TPA: energy transducer TonB [Gemmatimonadales bacterium]|nr:energy transducer TonB [Gemmatimonadales bacterium]
MPLQRRVFLPALLILLSVSPCHAQAWDSASAVQQFAFGPVNVLVIADTVAGLGVWAATSSTEYQGERHEFGTSFNPDSMDRWLDQAHAVITRDGAADSSSPTTLQTTPLVAVDSSAIVVLRKMDASRWSDQIELVFLDKDRKSLWSVDASAAQADSFVTGMFVEAARSRLMPRIDPAVLRASAGSDADAAPRLIKIGRVRPPKRVAGISARVTLQFVIGLDGKPERASFRTITYSDPRFIDAAIATIMESRFSPGKLSGVPVRVQVAQGVRFNGQAQQQQSMDNFPKPRPLVGDVLASPPF